MVLTATIIEAFRQALHLIASGNPEVFSIVLRSLYVSGLGTLLACLWGIPLSIIIGLYSFRGKWLIKNFFNAMLGIPTVTLGLLLVMFFSKSGPLGFFHLLYTTNGIAIGQAILITPIIVSYASSALGATDMQVRDLAKTLGASDLQANLAIVRETKWAMALSIISAFNRGFGELGIAMMVGGNITYVTRMLTTAIALQGAMGEFAFAIALAIILMTIVFIITVAINILERLHKS